MVATRGYTTQKDAAAKYLYLRQWPILHSRVRVLSSAIADGSLGFASSKFERPSIDCNEFITHEQYVPRVLLAVSYAKLCVTTPACSSATMHILAMRNFRSVVLLSTLHNLKLE